MKILVIDDHPLFLDGLTHVVKCISDDIIVTQANNANMALSRLALETDYSLIILDLNMPDMSGVEFLQVLSKRTISIPTLIISAHDNPSIINDAIKAGALGFVPKTFNSEDLLKAIRSVMQGEPFLPNEIKIMLSHSRQQTNILTPRQRHVLTLLVKGYSNKKIAESIDVSEHTVKSHLKALFRMFNVENRTAAVNKAQELGIL